MAIQKSPDIFSLYGKRNIFLCVSVAYVTTCYSLFAVLFFFFKALESKIAINIRYFRFLKK